MPTAAALPPVCVALLQACMRLLRSLFYNMALGKFLDVQAAFGASGLHAKLVDASLDLLRGPSATPVQVWAGVGFPPCGWHTLHVCIETGASSLHYAGGAGGRAVPACSSQAGAPHSAHATHDARGAACAPR